MTGARAFSLMAAFLFGAALLTYMGANQQAQAYVWPVTFAGLVALAVGEASR